MSRLETCSTTRQSNLRTDDQVWKFSEELRAFRAGIGMDGGRGGAGWKRVPRRSRGNEGKAGWKPVLHPRPFLSAKLRAHEQVSKLLEEFEWSVGCRDEQVWR